MNKIKKFNEFINESVYDENDGFTSSVSEETPITKTPLPKKEVEGLRGQLIQISNCVKTIINGDEKEIEKILRGNRAMMVCSMPGIGLTHSIEDGVSKSNGTEDDVFTIPDDFKINELLLYKSLYKYNNKLIVIEDFERILDNYHCCKMLRRAMSDDRIITFPRPVVEKDDIPAQFTFNGYIMLTSRMRIEELMEKYKEQLRTIRAKYELFNIFPDEKFKNTYVERERY